MAAADEEKDWNLVSEFGQEKAAKSTVSVLSGDAGASYRDGLARKSLLNSSCRISTDKTSVFEATK